jgi:exodeoxyribonuclease-3
VRVATWNVNGLTARLAFVQHWLLERQPDVVGLQELKLADEKFPHDEIQAAGYTAVTHGQKAWNGVAVLSRKPARVVQRGLPGHEDLGARLLTVEVEGLSFTTVYVPNGKSVAHDDFARKLAWLDELAAHFAAHHDPTQPAILCGDFNIVPAPIDSWNENQLAGQIFHTDDERTRFAALLEWGFCDLFRALHPDEQAFSWWDYRGGAFHRKQGLRIDFLLGTKSVVDRLESVEIDREWRKKKEGLTASDHAPVVAELG